MSQSGVGPLAAPIETSAHGSDRARERKPDRPWYVYASRLLPAEAGRWVDLGCGQGEFLEQAGAGGGFGLDFWSGNARAAAKAGHPAVAGDLNHPLPFRDGSLDGISLLS